MLKNLKKITSLVLCAAILLGFSNPVLAAEASEQTDPIIINVFDPDDPYLDEIVDASSKARTTSRPTTVWDLDAKGQYSYSAYSSNNIMWTKYRFYTQGGDGCFFISTKATNTNYRVVVHNCSNGKDYYYNISKTSQSFYEFNISGWSKSPYFYFGIDTTKSGGSVSVSGAVDTY